MLIWFARRRPDLPFPWMFWLFGAFIISCGFTHFMEVLTTAIPVYRFSALLKLVTALVSWGTVFALVKIAPQALLLRSPLAMEREIEARRRADEMYQKHYHLLFKANPHPMWVYDSVTQAFLEVNDSAVSHYGYSREEFLAMTIRDIRPPEQLPLLYTNLQQREAAVMSSGVWKHRKKDGTLIDVEISSHEFSFAGRPARVVLAYDVSERQRVEEKFRRVVESAPNAIVAVNGQGQITLVNAQTEKLFGYKRSELLGQPVELLVPERFREQHPSYRGSFFANPQTRAMGVGRDLYGRRKDGSEFPVEIGLNPIETDEGVLVLSAIVDITERKRAEAKFRLVVESAPNAMVMVDPDGRIVLVNAQTEKLFGYSREELLRQPVELLVPERLRAQHPEFRQGFFASPQARAMGVGRDLYGRRKDGSEFPVEIGLNPIETEEGLLVLSAIVDITERKRAEQRLRLVVESAPNAMVMVNANGRIVLVNAQTEKLFGYTSEELLDQPVELLVPERLRGQHPKFRQGFFASPQARAMGVGRDLYGRRKDGSEFPVEIGLNPIETDEGIMVLSAIVDITERKRAEHRLRLVVESAPNAMVMVNQDGRIVLVNAQTEKLFGYARDELLGAPVELLVPERLRQQHPSHRAGFFANPQTRAMGVGRDLYGRRKDGSEFAIEIGLNPIETDEGLLVLSAIVDITERKRAEQRFRLMVESAPNAMVMVNQDGRIVLVNAQTEKLFGYTREELLHQPVELLVPERLRDRHPTYFSTFFAKPQTRAMGVGRDLYGLRKDGSEFPVEIGLNPIETDEGLLVLSAIVDITERKRAETALRKAHDEMELRVQERTADLAKYASSLQEQAEMLDLVHDAILARRLDGTITFWNRGAQEMYGWSAADARGKATHQLLQTQFPKPLQEIEADLVANGRWEGTLLHTRRDGAQMVVNSRKALKKDAQGQPSIVLEINNDITERIRSEEALKAGQEAFTQQLQRTNQELEAANRELESFSYSVSHDLRAPLRAIDGFSRIVVEEHASELSAEAKRYLDLVRENTKAMGRLVDDLLKFSRLARQPIIKQPVATDKLVRQCLGELAGEQEGREVRIVVGDLPACQGEPTLLKQVWINLLANALKYTRQRQPAVIEIGCDNGSKPSGPRTYFVKDNGVGFDMKYAGKLFGVFQRLHRAEDYEGTGVGLAIVQRIVQRHGGRVWADSRPNEGTTFYLTLEGDSLHA